jgi:PilZ domain
MSDEVTDVRKNERFDVVEPFDGSFGGVEVTFVNFSLGGAQLVHAQPLRIGTRGRLAFKRGEVAAETHGRVVWSHMAQTPQGLRYKSGLQLDPGEVPYATALHALLRAGVLARDTSSLERKKEREAERAKRLSSTFKAVTPPS